MIKIALPAGELRRPVSQLLSQVGLDVPGYGEGSRSYRLSLDGRARVRVFRERDIPVQIALGQYHVGICGAAWVEEFLARNPRQGVVKLGSLPLAGPTLFLMAAPSTAQTLADLSRLAEPRIVTEFPHLAEALALALRLPRYRIIPVWGSAEAYPPEDADLALALASHEEEVVKRGLVPLLAVLEGPPVVIAHRQAIKALDMGWVLSALASLGLSSVPGMRLPASLAGLGLRPRPPAREREVLRVALPDGHQKPHVLGVLAEAGLSFPGYAEGERRPLGPWDGIEAKVIRPQDMPQMVALGAFDLAFTGRDCFLEHIYRFPSSPVAVALDLGKGAFNMSAVVSVDLPVETMEEAISFWRREGRPLVRIASEFVAIADHYARSRHLWRYRVIPTAGASEGFVPEDADLLIEGTETGRTLAENRLKAIDVLFRSTTCVVVGRHTPTGRRGELLRLLLDSLRPVAVAGSATI